MQTRLLGNTALSATAIFLLSGYSSCDPIIENNGFDLWCGDHLCAWEVEAGSVRQVPTWHRSDKGVEFVGDNVAISQLSDVTWTDGVDCIRFDLVADVEMTATVTLELDFYDDGLVDYAQPIPTSDWAPIHYLVSLPRFYQGIRFRLKKEGPGKVVLAQVYAEKSTECIDPVWELEDLPVGAGCGGASQCASELCLPSVTGMDDHGVCATCVGDEDCNPGDVCGAESPFCAPLLSFYLGCGPAGRHQLGERCAVDAECATGICNEGMCSTCLGPSDCDAGERCEMRERGDDMAFWWAPYQCDPGTGGASSGEPCLIDADCADSTCVGTGDLKVCTLDGRLCDSVVDCPSGMNCVTIGTAGGTCQ